MLVAAVRGRAEIPDTADIAIPAVVIAEYLAGVHLDPDTDRQAAQRAFLDQVLAVVPVCDYDRAVAEQHSYLLAHTARLRRRRGAHGLIVAATARATRRIIFTTDARAGFDELPDVDVRIASQ